MMEKLAEMAQPNRFGTFAGVFTPSILTILGVIMFIRAGFVIGEAGILGAVLILLICKSITLLTALSIGAISTNMQMRGGGAYFMISRVLGPEFGGAIGIALFLAQALSVPFYILGFTEALVSTFPQLGVHYQICAMISAIALFLIAYVGAGWAIKAQYFIMIILAVAIVAFMVGSSLRFDQQTFLNNFSSSFTTDPATGQEFNFWIVLAIYFPAVTGILAGVNMSGDLKDPGRSIPQGTLWAIGVGFVIYLLQILICGGAFPREDLIARPFELLKDHAWLGFGPVVVAGMFAAALSSALGSYLGAPRILQAVARDGILGIIRPFAKGTAAGDEPRAGLILTGLITMGVIFMAGNGSGGGALNAVAAVITMFFLYTYGMVNLAAFIEAFGNNPSFRPRFKVFHWFTALLGALGCIGVAFLINGTAAIGAIFLIVVFLWYLKRAELTTTFGDARRGFVFANLRKSLLRLAEMEEDSKNWRPTILVFSGNPASRESLVTFSVWLESGRGIVLLANVLVGEFDCAGPARASASKLLENFCREKNIQAFPAIVVAENVMHGISALLQSSAVGPVRPNLVMWGWSTDSQKITGFLRYLRMASYLGMGLILLYARSLPRGKGPKRIDVWWRGKKNGELMIILAHLLIRNWEWSGAAIRVLRLVGGEDQKGEAVANLKGLIEQARVHAEVEAIVSNQPFPLILHQYSGSADCVFLGFQTPAEGEESGWHELYSSLLEGMPTTILVSATGGVDMSA